MTLNCSITHIGGPTALIEVGELRLLTDPTFDPPGRHYNFGLPLIGSTKTAGPALELDGLGRIDAVLLSHDQHQDNPHLPGRDRLSRAGQLRTTIAGPRGVAGQG